MVTIGVDPVWTGDRVLIALRGDRRASAQALDVLAKGVTAQAAVRHHPLRHPGQALQKRDGVGEFMRLPGSQNEGHRPSQPVGDHTRLGAVAAPRAAQRFTGVPLSWSAPF